MVRRLTTTAIVLAAVALVGCGGDDDDSGADGSSGPAASSDSTADDSAEDDRGGGNGAGADAAADLGDFPIPAPPGSTLTFTNEIDDITAHTITVPVGQMESAIAFYDDWTASEDDEYQRIVAESGGVSWVRTTGSSADSSRLILVSAPLEGDTEVLISLTDDPPG
jgi:hypothetical protein